MEFHRTNNMETNPEGGPEPIRVSADGSVSGLPLRQFHEQERQPLAADAAVTEWSKRARKVFRQIHTLKAEFFESLFTEAPWADLSEYADESRRFSSFVKQVFARLRPEEVGHLPSSTEVNSWFQLFRRREQFREQGVPEEVLPQTRKVQEALQSATAGMKSDQERLKAQVEILQHAAAITTDGQVSTSVVKAAAAELEIASAPLPKLPEFEPRGLDDLTRHEWAAICSLQQRLRRELLEPKDPNTQRQRLLKLSASFEDLTRHQTTWVMAVFDNGAFRGCLARQMVQKSIVKEIGSKTVGFTRSCQADVKVIAADDLMTATLPLADDPGLPEYFRLVGVRGDRKVRQCLKVNTGRIPPAWRIEQLDLPTFQAWLAQGGIPIDTYVDEVIEPSFLHPETEDGSPVL